ncbi:hypothetical protein HN801_05195 [Candidatus Peregrinibacteria bacterium]|nr:hypothetical protein [Candidatus Peregrinibacteria bacterium]
MDNTSPISEEERQESLRQKGHKKNLQMVEEAKNNAIKTSIADRIRFTGSMAHMALTDFVDELKPKVKKRNVTHNFNSFPAQVEYLEQIVLMSAAPVDVMTDDFSENLDQWNIDSSQSNADIHIENGELVAANLGAIVTKEDFRGTSEAPITVSGTWKPIRDDASNTHSMTLRLRNNGDANDYRGQNGVYLVAYTNNDVFIGQWKDGVHTKLAEDSSRVLNLGKTYNFSVTDNGSEVTAVITDDQGVEVINLTGASAAGTDAGDKIVLQARERGMSRFDDIRISTPGKEEVVVESVDEKAAAIDAVFSDPIAVAEIVGPQQATYPDTPEGRLQALAARQAGYQEQINVLSLQKADIETLIVRQQNIIADAQASVSSALETIKRFTEQGDPENMRVTPSINVQARRFKYFFKLNYTDMPEGYSLKIGNDTTTIPEGGGSMNITHLPRPGGNVRYTLSLVDNNGEKVSNIGVVSIYQGKISRGGTTNFTSHLSKLSYIPNSDDGSLVTTEQKSDADLAVATDSAAIQNAETEILRLQPELDSIQNQIDTLERDKIPYSALHVKPSTDAGVFDVHYMSNRSSTYFEVFKQGTPGTSYTQLIEHPAGEMDGSTSFNMRRAQEGRGHGDVRIVMYTDASKTERLDEFTGHFNSRGGLVSGETNAVWGELETGRIVENPIEPQMSIQKITGPNILVQYQTPHDGARLVLEGGGHFATKTLTHEGGEDFESTMLTFNSSNREWNYRLQLFENRNNTVVAEYSFHWDPASKQLTLNGENTPIEVEADSEKEVKREVMQNIFDTQTGITTIDVSYASLRQVQGTHMYEASSFFINPDDAGTYINNSALKGHPDANGTFMQLLDSYEGALEEMLQDAAKIKVAAMKGDSQVDAEEYLRWNHHRISILRHLRELEGDFGVKLPTVEAIRDEGIRIFEANTDDFKTQQIKNVSMRHREERKADQKEETGGGGQLVGGDEEETLIAGDTSSYGGGFNGVDVDGQRLVFGEDLNKGLTNIDASILTFDKTGTTEVLQGSENTLVMLIHGASTVPGEEGKEEEGMNQLANSMSNAAHLISVRSGNRLGANGDDFNHEVALSEIKLVINEYTQAHSNIDSIIIAGYSWGGGATYEIADWITNDTEAPELTIQATAYIDAITHGGRGSQALPPPGTLSHGNWFQTADFLLHGMSTIGIDELKIYTQQQIAFALEGKNIDHYNIDEKVYPDVAAFITTTLNNEES